MLRFATPQDAPGLLEIYAPYVTGTIVSFEYDVPTLEEFARRIQDTTARFPYLVWEEDGALLGYAYAHPYAARPAYQWSAELTVYLRQGAARRGAGLPAVRRPVRLAAAPGGAHGVRLRHRGECPQRGVPPGFGLPGGRALFSGGL